MNKKYLMIACCLFAFTLSVLAQDYYGATNKVDSIGRKQGIWIEYKVVPKIEEIPGEYEWFVSPLDTMKRYNVKKENFNEVIVLRWFGLYIKGMKEGKWTEYSSSGNVVSEVNYRNGELYGTYLEYYTNGKIMIKCNIDTIRYFSGTAYNERGELIYENDSIDKVDFMEKFYEL